MLLVFASFLLALAAAPFASADVPEGSALQQLLQSAGAAAGDTAPDPRQLDGSATRGQQLPWLRAVMASPLAAPERAASLARSLREAIGSPHAVMELAGALAGIAPAPSGQESAARLETWLRAAPDPLAASLLWMAALAAGPDWPPPLPDARQLPDPLRFELALVIATLAQSHRLREQAFARLPPRVKSGLLAPKAFDSRLVPAETLDDLRALELVDRPALLEGMLVLVKAVERLQRFVTTARDLPSVAWTLETPLGQIVVDTTGRDNHHRLAGPLLVLDVGGDDTYEFLERGDARRISVLLDHRGNDRYIARAPGADPSSATLGYGILWDTEGDDHYLGTQHAQASALFGAALLVDGGGNNQFVASSHAQAQAIGGLAVLLGGAGDDQYTAQTRAQASAGPQGVALLIDSAGDDRYTLDNLPLVAPSPQLPAHNTSLGQGAGYGLRAGGEGRSAAGGMGVLLDLAGNDRYVAQVFAQGAGYFEGVGLLVDEGGNDRFDAAWYAMGAAAHNGAGILLKRGSGDDRYHASHSLSLGAAHDFSVGVFMDEGGNDHYRLGNLGLGAAHDNSTALFVDGAGDDIYEVDGTPCMALGASRMSDPDTARETLPNLGLFMDLGGRDRYPAHCAGVRNDAIWTVPRHSPATARPSQAGAGLDGEWPTPFSLPPLVPAHRGVLQ